MDRFLKKNSGNAEFERRMREDREGGVGPPEERSEEGLCPFPIFSILHLK